MHKKTWLNVSLFNLWKYIPWKYIVVAAIQTKPLTAETFVFTYNPALTLIP